MKAVSTAIGNLSQDDISKLEKEGNYTLLIDSEPLILQINEVEITSEDIPGWIVANKGALTVALDVTITPELLNEGNARNLLIAFRRSGKTNGYELTDRIKVIVAEHEALKQSINDFSTYICAEILADRLEIVEKLADGTEIEVNDIAFKVNVSKSLL